MVDGTRWMLLLSLAALPACEEPAPEDDPVLDEHETCWAYIDRAEACGENTNYAGQICGGEQWEAEMWSRDCIAADVDRMACLSELECEDFDRSKRDEACADVLAAAHEACPEHF